jgi:hypothetical protein
MIKVCRVCKIQFNTEQELTVCEDCVKAIVVAMSKDEESMVNLGHKMFGLPAQTFGIGGTGSVADFFRREINQVSK